LPCELLVTVDDFHVFGTRVSPSEYDPPLIVDADRMLTREVTLKHFKPVAGRRFQGVEKA